MNISGKFLGATLLPIAAGWLIAFPPAVEAGQSVGIISVRATVSPTVVMKFESSSMQLSVTERDIERGYIDVPGTFRLTLNGDRAMQQVANVTVDYEPNPYNFTSIQVAARTLETSEPGSDTMLALGLDVNALPATAAGRSDTSKANERSPDAKLGLAQDINEPQSSFENVESAKTFNSAQTVNTHGSVTLLGYRLILPEKIKAGNISVPLILSLQL